MTSSYLLGEAVFCHRKHKPNSPRPPPLVASSTEQNAHRDPYQLGAGELGTFWHPLSPIPPGRDCLSLPKLASSSAGQFSLPLSFPTGVMDKTLRGDAPLPEATWHVFRWRLECLHCHCSTVQAVSLEDSIGTVLPELWDLYGPLFCLLDHLCICGAFEAAAGDWGLAGSQKLA